MGSYRITDLVAASTPLAGTEAFEVVQAGYSRQLTLDGVLTWPGFIAAVDARVAALGGGSPSGPAAGDLAGTYPNPTLKLLTPNPAGTFGTASTIPVVSVDAKGRVTGITTVAVAAPALTGAVRYDTAQALAPGEKAQAQANIAAQAANTRLTAIGGLALLNSLVVWDDTANAHAIDLQPFMETFLGAPTQGAARAALGGIPTTRVTTAESPVTLIPAMETIIADATGGPVVVNLPSITAAIDGRWFQVKRRDTAFAGANVVTINADAADDIDGAPSVTLTAQYQSWSLVACYDAGGNSFWSVE